MKSENKKPLSKRTKYIIIGLTVIVILALLGFSRSDYRIYNKTLLEREKQRATDSIKESQHRQDSLHELLISSESEVHQLEILLQKAENYNYRLLRKINNREKTLDIVDTTFTGNANYSANRIDRQHQQNDTIR